MYADVINLKLYRKDVNAQGNTNYKVYVASPEPGGGASGIPR